MTAELAVGEQDRMALQSRNLWSSPCDAKTILWTINLANLSNM